MIILRHGNSEKLESFWPSNSAFDEVLAKLKGLGSLSSVSNFNHRDHACILLQQVQNKTYVSVQVINCQIHYIIDVICWSLLWVWTQEKCIMGSRRERVEIILVGGRPWGFSIKGGKENNKPLVISKVSTFTFCLNCGKFSSISNGNWGRRLNFEGVFPCWSCWFITFQYFWPHTNVGNILLDIFVI